MKRRKFIKASALGAAIPLSVHGTDLAQTTALELYEMRTYEARFRGDQALLLNFLNQHFKQLLGREGCSLMLFDEWGDPEPRKIYALITYPSADAYLRVQQQAGASALNASSDPYHQVPADKALYNRYSSWLLSAFDGIPHRLEPVEGATVFELRTYEGYSENAVQRKIKMFNEEEIDLFKKLDIRPVFFGEMLAGPYRPSLTYMINFKDMQERDANWQTFFNHPEWKAMAAKAEYANTVSHIRRTFLKQIRD